MKLLLDTANIEQIKSWMQTDAVVGVTTNPSLMAKETPGVYLDRLQEVVDAIGEVYPKKHLSVEVITTDPQEMIKQGVELSEKLDSDNIDLYVKVPCNQLQVITALANLGVGVNATACMTSLQAKLASEAGAHVVSFFYNRIMDYQIERQQFTDGEDPRLVLDEFAKLNSRKTPVICGSIRAKRDVLNCWLHGADYVTANPKIIEQMLHHPQTDKALKQFQEDIDRWRS